MAGRTFHGLRTSVHVISPCGNRQVEEKECKGVVPMSIDANASDGSRGTEMVSCARALSLVRLGHAVCLFCLDVIHSIAIVLFCWLVQLVQFQTNITIMNKLHTVKRTLCHNWRGRQESNLLTPNSLAIRFSTCNALHSAPSDQVQRPAVKALPGGCILRFQWALVFAGAQKGGGPAAFMRSCR